MAWDKVVKALEEAAHPYEEGVDYSANRRRIVVPGGVLLVGQGGETVFCSAFGCRSLLPVLSPVEADTVYDVASLTKVIVTTTLVMKLVEKGLLDFNKKLSHIFQTFGTHGKERMTVRHLLTHTSGYPATAPYYRQIAKDDQGSRAGMLASRGAVEAIYHEIFRARIDNLPGKVTRYSDIGFILLGHAIEVLTNSTLDKLALKQIFGPLGLRSMGYVDLNLLRSQGLTPDTGVIAPTAECPWRGRILCGEVHDDNAWVMGGVAPHAGVFSTADDVHRFASEMIACWHGRGSLVSQELLRQFWTVDGTDPKSTWALGWDTPSRERSSSGQYFSPRAVGHLGYTGCSLWIDPEREIDVVLLTNRIHPSPENTGIREFRPLIHNLVMEALGYGG